MRRPFAQTKKLSQLGNYLDKTPFAQILSHMDNNLDAFFAALSDPTRRAVVERLVSGAAPVSDLHAGYDMALPSFLKHIRVLEAAQIVRTEKTGRVRMVHIEAQSLAEAQNWLEQQRAIWEARFDRLDALVMSLHPDPNDEKDPQDEP